MTMKQQQFMMKEGNLQTNRMDYESPVCEIIEVMSEGELLTGSFGGNNEGFDSTDYSDDIWLN